MYNMLSAVVNQLFYAAESPADADALDLVMELAVELPTYQRSDLFAYNTNIIDESTLTPASELTPYNGPMSKLWEVSLKETPKD